MGRLHLLVVLAAVTATGVATTASSVGAAADPGSGRSDRGRSDGAGYRPPVVAPIVDGFREPAGPYGPGNRGLEYATAPGTPVGAIGAGRVVFAGQVAGRLAVTVLHPGGLRSSVTGLEEVLVTAGDLVALGAPVGRAGPRTHLGVREGERYLDPARLFGGRRRAVLIPVSSPSQGGTRVSGRPEPGRSPPTQCHHQRDPTSAREHPRSLRSTSWTGASSPGFVEPRGRSHRDPCRHHEAAARGRGALRPPDTPVEPEDEAVHPRRSRRHLPRRPAQDTGGDRDLVHLRPRPGRRRRDRPVHRHEEAGPGLDPGLRDEVRHAVHQPALARRHAHELRDHLQAGREDEGVPAHARLRRVRGDAEEGGVAAVARARQAGAQPQRHPRPRTPPRRGVHPRHQEGGHRGHRGQQAQDPRRGGGRHELRSRHHPVRDPGQRRCDPFRGPADPGHLGRGHRGSAHALQGAPGHGHRAAPPSLRRGGGRAPQPAGPRTRRGRCRPGGPRSSPRRRGTTEVQESDTSGVADPAAIAEAESVPAPPEPTAPAAGGPEPSEETN